MSQRMRTLITVKVPVAKLPSPNQFVPEITVEMRAAWPPNANWGAIHAALVEAYEKSEVEVMRVIREYGQ